MHTYIHTHTHTHTHTRTHTHTHTQHTCFLSKGNNLVLPASVYRKLILCALNIVNPLSFRVAIFSCLFLDWFIWWRPYQSFWVLCTTCFKRFTNPMSRNRPRFRNERKKKTYSSSPFFLSFSASEFDLWTDSHVKKITVRLSKRQSCRNCVHVCEYVCNVVWWWWWSWWCVCACIYVCVCVCVCVCVIEWREGDRL